MTRRRIPALLVCLLFTSLAAPAARSAEPPLNHYALMLSSEPLAKHFSTRENLASIAAHSYREEVKQKQAALRSQLETRNFRITGAVQTLLNAVFVAAPASRVQELKSLPDVVAVIPLRRRKLSLNAATQLVGGPAAWGLVGGLGNAGAGIKVAIIDTGIDETHPAFSDDSISLPPGFTPSTDATVPNYPNFTNNKVIVARSYVGTLTAPSDLNAPAADSRPDDVTPRDRVGHGTATASCVGAFPNTGAVTFNGMAPRAWLGNYKVFGSGEVNGGASDEGIIEALEDALSDGMDIASMSLGGSAFSGPLDVGPNCGNFGVAAGGIPAGEPCDPLAVAVESASGLGLLVVIAAGNSGPDYESAGSPGYAPSAVAVGASTNSHVFGPGVTVSGGPSNVQNLEALFSSDGPAPFGSITGPLRDVTQLGDNGLGCSSFPSGSLSGDFALIERGTCTFETKVLNAQAAGAVGVILYLADQTTLANFGGYSQGSTPTIPSVMVTNTAGLALKTYVDAHQSNSLTLNPNLTEFSVTPYNQLANFSSIGPSPGNLAIKPDLVATGTNMYMAAQDFDWSGEVYSSDRYTVANGTSFATPLVAGAAALVKQAHPGYSVAQLKSALVNSANSTVVTSDDAGNPVSVLETGAGLLNAGAGVSSTIEFNPVSFSFGALNGVSLPQQRQLTVTNNGSSSVSLSFSINSTSPASGVTVSVSPSTLSLAAGASGTLTAKLSGTIPSAGVYEGYVKVSGASTSLVVPYMFLEGDGVPADLVNFTGEFDATVNQAINSFPLLAVQLLDDYGVPISGAPVQWEEQGGTFDSADSTTDQYGIATAYPIMGASAGDVAFAVSVGGLQTEFTGYARQSPSTTAAGVVNAASFQQGAGVSPGSYISIFGSNLSDGTNTTAALPFLPGLDDVGCDVDPNLGYPCYVSVSFDVPSANLSVPGYMIYVSPTQVNLQLPWELQGHTSALMKVYIDYSYGNVVTIPLATYSPAMYENSGNVAALDANFKPIGSANPAVRGQVIQIYANGLGPVSNQPASGSAASSNPLSQTTGTPTVTIGGVTANVSFSGLAPGFPCLYQINAEVPTGIAAGSQPVVVSIGGVTSKTSHIQVQ